MELDGNKSARITDHALSMLEEAPADQPFFLNVGYIATHSPYAASEHDPALVEKVRDLSFRDIPPYVAHPWVKNEGIALGPDHESVLNTCQGYYAAVLELDANVNRILTWLDTHDRARDALEHRFGEYGDLHMIRTPEYKFVKRYPSGPHELFDLKTDREEMCNEFDAPALIVTRQRLETRLEHWYEAHEDPLKTGLRVKSAFHVRHDFLLFCFSILKRCFITFPHGYRAQTRPCDGDPQ